MLHRVTVAVGQDTMTHCKLYREVEVKTKPFYSCLGFSKGCSGQALLSMSLPCILVYQDSFHSPHTGPRCWPSGPRCSGSISWPLPTWLSKANAAVFSLKCMTEISEGGKHNTPTHNTQKAHSQCGGHATWRKYYTYTKLCSVGEFLKFSGSCSCNSLDISVPAAKHILQFHSSCSSQHL